MIQKYPPWKNAIEEIIVRFNKEGFGIVFSKVRLDEMFGIKPARTIAENQKNQFERMAQMEALKIALLKEYQLHFSNIRGQGYQIMHPNDQVAYGADKHTKKAKRELRRAGAIIVHVRAGELDNKHEEMRLHKLRLNGFQQHALAKRKLPILKQFKKLTQN